MIAPCDRSIIVGTRLAASPLIVENHVVLLREMQHLGQEIPVVRAGPAVKHDQRALARGTVASPVQRHRRRRRVARLARLRDGVRHAAKSSGGARRPGSEVARMMSSSADFRRRLTGMRSRTRGRLTPAVSCAAKGRMESIARSTSDECEGSRPDRASARAHRARHARDAACRARAPPRTRRRLRCNR